MVSQTAAKCPFSKLFERKRGPPGEIRVSACNTLVGLMDSGRSGLSRPRRPGRARPPACDAGGAPRTTSRPQIDLVRANR